MRVIHLSLLLLFFFTSCNEEMEQAELTAKRIQDEIRVRKVTITSISASQGTTVFTGSTYTFKPGGYITITTGSGSWRTFNLGELVSYTVGSDLAGESWFLSLVF